MRACEGCRRRKIKCDAATTNTWPCSACIRLKLHCVRPNGFDGANDSTTYDTTPMNPSDQYQQMPMQHQVMNPGVAPSGSMMEHHYAGQNVFPTPPMHQPPPPPAAQQQPSPEAYSPGEYQHHDLADLLGTLKVNETGTGRVHDTQAHQCSR